MLDKNKLEQALLLNVIRSKKWDILILNGIDERYFTNNNKKLYQEIKEYVQTKDSYPDIQITAYKYEITDDEISDILSIDDIQGLCETVKNEYVKNQIRFKVGRIK